MLQIVRHTTYRSELYRVRGPIRWGGRMPALYLSLLGRFFSTGHFAFQQVSPGFAVHVVESGRGMMKVGVKAYAVGPGDAFAFFPGCHYDYHDFPATPWRYTWLTLEGTQVQASLGHVGLSQARPLLHLPPAGRLEELLAEIQAAYARPTIAASYAIAAGWRLIDALAGTDSTDVAPANIAEAARFLIDRRTLEGWSVQRLARQLQISRSALFRHFRAAYGSSPKPYLDRVRLGRAKVLLRRSSAPLKQIASACGFADSRHLIAAFRKNCGVTPGRWRRGHT